MKLIDKHNAPTPVKWRKLGYAIALLGTMIQASIAGMQLGGSEVMTHKQYFLFVIGIAVVQWLGQTITNFATEDKPNGTDSNA